MATLLFSALGTALGGPIGGAIGAVVGSQIDGAIFGPASEQGPRLKDLTITTSSYGATLPRHFGQMRVGGTIIWATNLVENSSTSSGKGQPSVTTYSYTSSFAVALASRSILGVGRIWADGNLLRGAAGDMKVGGSLRIYTGTHEQLVDPLIASAEGIANCPAFRGTAYVVFEDLQLGDYGNRIPSLNFEILADDGTLSLASLFDGIMEDVDAHIPLDGILGYSCEEPLGNTLSKFAPVIPMLCDAGGGKLTITRDRLQSAPIAISEPAVSATKGDFGGKAGFTRKRTPTLENPPRVMRYYDINLDYQPGSQRALGRPLAGQPRSIDLPACLDASNAFRLIAYAARNNNWARETISWRCAELDPTVAPGAIVTLAGQAGHWRVIDWEWRDTGVDLTLERIAPGGDTTLGAISPGQANLAADLAITPTAVDAFELPWDGNGSADTTALYAAVSSSGAGWKGAAVYVDQGDGTWTQIGASGRARATIGTTTTALPRGSVALFDRSSTVTVQLIGADMSLTDASPHQMVLGANQALVGEEIIQFGKATALGAGLWQLGQLLRGRGGTEAAIDGHAVGEAFILLDPSPMALDPSKVSSSSAVQIGAMGLNDTSMAQSAIACRGIGTRPLSPVLGTSRANTDGSLTLAWVRRARGAWRWLDGVDAPLQEETEAYQVGYGPTANPIAVWNTDTTTLTLSATTLTSLRASLIAGNLWVRQAGTYALSPALALTVLN